MAPGSVDSGCFGEDLDLSSGEWCLAICAEAGFADLMEGFFYTDAPALGVPPVSWMREQRAGGCTPE